MSGTRGPVVLLARGATPALLLLLACTSAVGAPGETRGALAVAGEVRAVDGSDGRRFRTVPLDSMREDVELLLGHPDSAGRPFVMRIRELPGTIVPPHVHPVDEHITVVRGTWWFGTGERWDSTALRRLDAGAYAFVPAGTTMFGWAPDGAVVQVHGVGPFHIHWTGGVVVLDASTAATFRFALGAEVVGARGRGRVRAGYANGALVQYEVDTPDGGRYMAREGELRAP